MGMIDIALPAPAANGSGTWVDASAFGALKTITSVGNGGDFEPFVTIECSNETSPTHEYPINTFDIPGTLTVQVACMWMRARVSNYRGGGSPTVSVGGQDSGTTNAQLAVTAGNGIAAPTNTSSLPLYKTIQVAGAFRGAVNVEISEDGTTYNQAFSANNPGAQYGLIAASDMRVSRNGVPDNSPGSPTVWVAATQPLGGSKLGPQILSSATFTVGVPVDHETLPIPAEAQGQSITIWGQQVGPSGNPIMACTIPDEEVTGTTYTVYWTGLTTIGDIFRFWFIQDL